MPDHLEVLPAVDIKGGQAVQLVQGVDGSEKRFGDPVQARRALSPQGPGAGNDTDATTGAWGRE